MTPSGTTVPDGINPPGPKPSLRYAMNTEVLADPSKWTADELFKHLYNAAYVEFSTIPLYLYAAYSIKGQSYSEWSPGRGPADDFRTIAIEEMLHLCLVRNMIVSIGRGHDIKFYDANFIPTYPSTMLNRLPRLYLNLEPLSSKLVREVFMEVEKPMPAHAAVETDEYHTLGQFYASLRAGFDQVYADDPRLFDANRPDLQYGTAYWNEGGGGGPLVIMEQPWGPEKYTLYPIGAVHKAIDIIVEQGEGIVREGEDQAQLCDQTVNASPADPTPGLVEYTHFAKFCRIATGLEPTGVALDAHGFPIALDDAIAVWPMLRNCSVKNLQGPVRDLAEFFNAAFCYLLALLDELYNTSSTTVKANEVSRRYGLERTFIAAMQGMLFPLADLLVRTPSGVGNFTAGPPFGFYQFKSGNIKTELISLCERSVKAYPSLGGDNSVRWLASLLPDIEYPPA